MPLYESTFIARHDMSTQQVSALAETVTNLVSENGGEITKTEYWGLRTLAYRIKKNRKGHYYFFNVDAPPAAIRELERNLRLNEDVLRYLTVAVEELDPNPSPMMQARSSREERGRRGGGFGRSRSDSGDRARSRDERAESADTAPDTDGKAKLDAAVDTAPDTDGKAKLDAAADTAPDADDKAKLDAADEVEPGADDKPDAAPVKRSKAGAKEPAAESGDEN